MAADSRPPPGPAPAHHGHHGHHGQDGHAGHAHGVTADCDTRQLTIALGLILGFMAVEVTGGILAHSLALLSDAGHMLTDAAAIGLSLAAARLALRPAAGAMTYGFRRAEILSAQANGVTLLILAAFIAYEAVRRLVHPPAVEAGLVLGVALVGVAVNLAATWTLARANRRSMNVEGSLQHLLTDLYAFAGTAVAAVVILLTGFDRADPIVSLAVAGLMVRSGYALVKASGRVFLEAAPAHLDPQLIGEALVGQAGVREVHDLHVWEITSGFPALSAHVLVGEDVNCHAIRRGMEAMLHDRFALAHTTLQVDHEGGDLIELELAPRRPPD
ncbi:MAG: cobalt-zinc-cadmium efflux system protein [Solirubrobacteraceae bacterium]|jgi:cobalt-zinc-cadmium efflux system protein|nr:cobalt-zinc-cadmium efflux system protein [Solirubrobacteraceae bacterium]